MNLALLPVVVVAVSALYATGEHLYRRRHPHRTPADVARDAAEHRRKREIADLYRLWPDPPDWDAQAGLQRLRDAIQQQRKENDQ